MTELCTCGVAFGTAEGPCVCEPREIPDPAELYPDVMDQGGHIDISTDMDPLSTPCACGETVTGRTEAEATERWQAHIEQED